MTRGRGHRAQRRYQRGSLSVSYDASNDARVGIMHVSLHIGAHQSQSTGYRAALTSACTRDDAHRAAPPAGPGAPLLGFFGSPTGRSGAGRGGAGTCFIGSDAGAAAFGGSELSAAATVCERFGARRSCGTVSGRGGDGGTFGTDSSVPALPTGAVFREGATSPPPRLGTGGGSCVSFLALAPGGSLLNKIGSPPLTDGATVEDEGRGCAPGMPGRVGWGVAVADTAAPLPSCCVMGGEGAARRRDASDRAGRLPFPSDGSTAK
jgi:hypothetical protein